MFEALLNGILMRARECSEDKVSSVWVALRDAKLISVFNGAANLIDIAEINMGINSMRNQVHPKGY